MICACVCEFSVVQYEYGRRVWYVSVEVQIILCQLNACVLQLHNLCCIIESATVRASYSNAPHDRRVHTPSCSRTILFKTFKTFDFFYLAVWSHWQSFKLKPRWLLV